MSSSSAMQEYLDLPKELAQEGNQFIKRCVKPDKKEFLAIAQAVGVGFLVMGFVGFLVKLIHIPINSVLGKDNQVSVDKV